MAKLKRPPRLQFTPIEDTEKLLRRISKSRSSRFFEPAEWAITFDYESAQHNFVSELRLFVPSLLKREEVEAIASYILSGDVNEELIESANIEIGVYLYGQNEPTKEGDPLSGEFTFAEVFPAEARKIRR